MAITVAVASDTHCNSYFGLCPPVFNHHGGQHKANAGQRWLWRHWLAYVEQVKAQADGSPILTIFNGDLCDIIAKSNNLITKDKVEMLRLTYASLQPLIDISRWVYVVAGTSAHTDGFEEKIAEDIDAVKYSDHQWAHPRLRLDVEGVHIWAGHHGRMGRLPHTQRLAGIRLAAETGTKCFENHIRPPDVIFRGHHHRWSDSGDNHRVRGIYLPAWQLPTSYIYKLDADAHEEVGGVIMRCEAGEYALWKYKAPVSHDRARKVRA